ncbi:MAG: hypothetical protein AAGF79_16715, partial [Pseudomonadota bacterium]
MKILVFLGSTRQSTPPRPARLGERVSLAAASHLTSAGVSAPVIDPLAFALQEPFKPHFACCYSTVIVITSLTICGPNGTWFMSPKAICSVC